MRFYTNFKLWGPRLFLRGYDTDGKRVSEALDISPELYVLDSRIPKIEPGKRLYYHAESDCYFWSESCDDPLVVELNPFWSLEQRPLRPIEFTTPAEMREFLKNNPTQVFGNNKPEYPYIEKRFGTADGVDWDEKLINIGVLDIEVESEQCFGTPNNPNERINAITIFCRGKYYVFALGDYTPHLPNVLFYKAPSEMDLLLKFIRVWNKLDLDVVTGWNCKFFDIPYIIERIKILFDEKTVKKLSPFGLIQKTDGRDMMHRDAVFYEIGGIAVLDLMEAYLKFVGKYQDSMGLGAICQKDLGEEKLDYVKAGYKSLKDLYTRNFQMFIEYNIHDVTLVKKLDEHRALLNLVFNTAYLLKINYVDVFSQIRMWETMIYNFLSRQKVQAPAKVRGHGEYGEKIEGAYVKEAQKGARNWVVSFDATSLYPSVVMQFNISPEKMVRDEVFDIRQDRVIDRQFDSAFLKERNITLAGNGFAYDCREQGVIPAITEHMFAKRKEFKGKMLKAKEALQLVERELETRK